MHKLLNTMFVGFLFFLIFPILKIGVRKNIKNFGHQGSMWENSPNNKRKFFGYSGTFKSILNFSKKKNLSVWMLIYFLITYSRFVSLKIDETKISSTKYEMD